MIRRIICLILAIGFSLTSFLWTFLFGREFINTAPDERKDLKIGRNIVLCSDALSFVLVVICLVFAFK